MDVVTIDHLSVGDVIEGPKGPEHIIEIDLVTGRIYFRNEDRSAYFGPKERITRYVEAKILEQAGVLV